MGNKIITYRLTLHITFPLTEYFIAFSPSERKAIDAYFPSAS
nr:MAG TPA: hypothetical protein [Caudoviricetes sp.]